MRVGAPEVPHGARRRGPVSSLRSSFLGGLVVVIPVGLTLWLMWAFAGWMDAVVLPFIPERLRPERYIGLDVHGIGIVFFLIFTVAVGWFARGWIGRWVIRSTESLLRRTPVIRSIYGGAKQIAEAIISQDGTSFDKVCLVEYPQPGSWALAFVASTAQGELEHSVGGHEDVVGVFLPTTPNPTTGFLFFVPRGSIAELEMSLEDGVKLIMSGGLIQPPRRLPPGPVPLAEGAT